MEPKGMIHGRFQPFHKGHFDYLSRAMENSEQLIVGITNPDPTMTSEHHSDSHRHLTGSNPYSYFLRMRMIQMSILLDDRLKDYYPKIIIVPFPVNKPDLWEHYIPLQGVVQIMRILEPWDREKRLKFEQAGFKVHVLEGSRAVSGTEVRDAIRSGDNSWQDKVPAGTLHVLTKWLSETGASRTL